MEAGETPEEALKREIREELSTEISVDEFLCTVEYDYPAFGLRPSSDATRQSQSEFYSALTAPSFHLTMHCYLCSLLTEALHLNEHEAAKWLTKDELESVKWLPADLEVVEQLIENMEAAIKREESDARISSAMPLGLSKNYPEREQARTKFK